MTANERLRDLILRRAVVRDRAVRAHIKDALATWRSLGRDVDEIIRATPDPLTSDRALDVLLRAGLETRRVVVDLTTSLTMPLAAFAVNEIAELPIAIERGAHDEIAVPFHMAFVSDAAGLLAAPLGGGTVAGALDGVQADVQRGLRTALTAGVARKQSVDAVARVVRTVIGNRGQTIERIIRSEFARVANQAALLTYQRNRQVVRAVQWAATLSGRTCLVCAAFHGRVWTDWDKVKLPVVASHATCRCMLLPVLKKAVDLGLPDSPDLRATFDGRAADVLTYADWFAQQDEAFQRDVLGPTRLTLYREKKVRLSGFVRQGRMRPLRAVQRRMSAR